MYFSYLRNILVDFYSFGINLIKK